MSLKPEDSWNYMPPIFVPSQNIATQILVTAKLNGGRGFILRDFAFDITRPN